MLLPKCRDMTELSTDYAEGALPWRRRLGVRLHLAYCSLCRAYYDQLDKARRLLRGRALDGPDAATEAAVLAARRPEGGGP